MQTLISRFNEALKNGKCIGFCDYLEKNRNVSWEACKLSLEYIPLSEINYVSFQKYLEGYASSPNDALLYVSLFILFKLNVPFKLKSVDILQKISSSPVKFDNDLVHSYVLNMRNKNYGIQRSSNDSNSEVIILENFNVSYVDLYDEKNVIIHKSFGDKKFYRENLVSGQAIICKTKSLFEPGSFKLTYCDFPSVIDDFNMTSPNEMEGEAGTTGLQIALRFLSKAPSLVRDLRNALRIRECTGFSDYLDKNPGISWEVCRDSLDEHILFPEIGHGSFEKYLEQCATSTNDALLYLSLFILFKFNIPFKLKSANFIQKISSSSIKFDHKLLQSYIKNMNEGVYGLPSVPQFNPKSPVKYTTVLDHFDASIVDFERERSQVQDSFNTEYYNIEQSQHSSKMFCKALALTTGGDIFRWCDRPSIEDFKMSDPKANQTEAGTTGLQIATHFLSQ